MRFNRLLSALAVPVGAGVMMMSLTACGNDEPDGGGDNLHNRVYQQYEVLIQDGSVQAFANLRRASASGERVRLSGISTLMANGQEMLYTKPISPDMPEFTYAMPIDPGATAVTYTLRVNSEFSLRNTIDLANIPEARYTLTDNTLSPKLSMKIDLTGMRSDEVTVSLSASPMSDSSLISTGSVAAGGNVVFPSLPAPGQYWMTITTRRVFPTSENDGEASGSITGIRSVTHRVTVTD